MAKLDLPENTSLPFLVYGIFKPKKYKWNNIVNIDEITHIDEPDKFIKEIIPLKIKSQYLDKGYLIKFNGQYSKKAYEYICESESGKKYEWKSIKIYDNPVNVLINKEKVKDFYPENFDYELPFFAYGIFKPSQIAFSKISRYVKKN